MFRREGVFHEIEALALCSITSSRSKDKDKSTVKDISKAPSPGDSGIRTSVPVSIAVITWIPGYKKLSSLLMEHDEANTLRVRVIRSKYLASDDSAGSDDVFTDLRKLVERVIDVAACEKDLAAALGVLAALLGSQHTLVLSFELLQSGIIDGLWAFFADSDRSSKSFGATSRYLSAHFVAVRLSGRQEPFFNAFTSRRSTGSGGQMPFAIVVKK